MLCNPGHPDYHLLTTLIHYELRGPFNDVIVMSSIAQYNCDVTKRATQLIVYQGDHEDKKNVLESEI